LASKADIIPVGASVALVSTKSLALELGITTRHTHWLLHNMSIPRMKFGPRDFYFNLYALELVLFAVLGPGGYPIAVPGMTRAQSNGFKKKLPPDLVASLTDPNNPLHARCAIAGLSHASGGRKYLEARLVALAKTLLKQAERGTVSRKETAKNAGESSQKGATKQKNGRKRRTPAEGFESECPLPPGRIRPNTKSAPRTS